VTTTQLNLFGGGGKKAEGQKGPGMMDQLAMFKKAQAMASKKKELDAELSKMTFEGQSSNGKVTLQMKYVASMNPMDPNPEYDPQDFVFDDEWYESCTPEELSVASKEAIEDAIKKTNEAATEKYAVLQEDLMAAFGQGGSS